MNPIDNIYESNLYTCIICLENYQKTLMNDHRVVSLNCGHVFGRSCIYRWLRDKNQCPKCNQHSTLDQIRLIYISTDSDQKLKTYLNDTINKLKNYEKINNEYQFDLSIKESEIERLKNDLKKEHSMVSSLEKKLKHTVDKQKTENQMTSVDCVDVKNANSNLAIDKIKIKNSTNELKESNINCKVCDLKSKQLELNLLIRNEEIKYSKFDLNQKFWHHKSLMLKFDARQMVIAKKLIVITQSATFDSRNDDLLVNSGIRLIDLKNLDLQEFIGLHWQPIDDISLNSDGNSLLTLSQDKNIKLVDLESKNVIMTFKFKDEITSICWNRALSDVFYVASRKGNLFECKLTTLKPCRFGKIGLSRTKKESIDKIRFLHQNFGFNHDSTDLLITTTSKLSFFCQFKSQKYFGCSKAKMKAQDNEKIIYSNVCDSGNLLLSVKSKKDPKITHRICDYKKKVNKKIDDLRFEYINTFECDEGTENITKCKTFKHPSISDSFLLCSITKECASIWQKDDYTAIQKIVLESNIKDFDFTEFDGRYIIVFLTKNSIHIYKWFKPNQP